MKDTFYFPHDYNSRCDPKLQDVLATHGVAGIGIFWCIIEQLYEQGGILPLKLCKTIAFALHVDCTIVESIVNDFELFTNDGEIFWSDSVKRRLCKRSDIAEKRKMAAERRWHHASAEQEQCNSNAFALQNDAKESKEKESKDNKESVREKNTRFSPPTLDDIKNYVAEKGLSCNAEKFFDFYQSKGWMVGKNRMKDWRAAVRNWARTEKQDNKRDGIKFCNDEWK